MPSLARLNPTGTGPYSNGRISKGVDFRASGLEPMLLLQAGDCAAFPEARVFVVDANWLGASSIVFWYDLTNFVIPLTPSRYMPFTKWIPYNIR